MATYGLWRDETVLRTNYIENPNGVNASGSLTAIRTNLVTNPTFGTSSSNIANWAAANVANAVSASTTGNNGSGWSLAVSGSGSTIQGFVSPGGDSGAIRLGMQAGKTYTFSCSTYISGAYTGPVVTVPARVRNVIAYTKSPTDNGGAYREWVGTPATTTAAGYVWHSVTFTIPSDATEAFIRVYQGSQAAADTLYVDKAILEERPVAHTASDYFDGATWTDGMNLTKAWTGTVDSSSSTLSGYVPTTWGAFNSKIWQGSGGSTIWIMPTGTGVTAAVYDSTTAASVISGSTSTVTNTSGFKVNSSNSTGVSSALLFYTSTPTLINSASTSSTTNYTSRFVLQATSRSASTTARVRVQAVINSNSAFTYTNISNVILETAATDGSYFDGSTAGGDSTNGMYRWTGAANNSISQKYLPALTQPSWYPSSQTVDDWYVDGFSLSNYAFNIESIDYATAEPRAKGTTIPQRNGILPRFNSSYESSEIALKMWVLGCEPDGTIPSTFSARRKLFDRNLQTLLQLMTGQNGLSYLAKIGNFNNNTDTVKYAQVINTASTPVTTMMARQRAEITFTFTVVEAFWSSAQVFSENSTASSTLPQILNLSGMGSAPVDDALVTIYGPVSSPIITCDASGSWVKYNGNLTAGQSLVLNVDTYQATINGVPVNQNISHGGHAKWVYIPPRNVSGGNIYSTPAFAPTVTLTGSGASSATYFNITYNRKYLVP